MIKTDPITRSSLHRAFDRLIQSEPSTVMAVPIGFPIVGADYLIRERIPQEIGMIRRYVLEGVCRFGPCTSAELDDLLALGRDVVEKTLAELMECIPEGISCSNGQFHAASPAQAVLNGGPFVKVISQSMKFIINGLSDTLLPIDFWKSNEKWRLYPNPQSQSLVFVDVHGQPADVAAKLKDRMGCGREDLKRWIASGDVEGKEKVGVPKGADYRSDEPTAVEMAWVVGFLLVDDDGVMRVLAPSGHPLAILPNDLPASREYIFQVCEGVKPWEMDIEKFGSVCEAMGQKLGVLGSMHPRSRPGEVMVALPMADGKPCGDGLSGNELQAWQKTLDALVHGCRWDFSSRFVLRMFPADAATAKWVAVKRGLKQLRTEILARPTGADSEWLRSQWSGWQERFLQEIPEIARFDPVDVSELLQAADAEPDTELVGKIEDLMGGTV